MFEPYKGDSFIIPRLHKLEYKPESNQNLPAILNTGRKYSYVIPPNLIYHYTNFEAAKKILTNANLKFSRPSTFNDPFDMYEGLIEFENITNNDLAEIIHKRYPTASHDWVRAQVKLEKRNRNISRGNGANFLSQFKERYGICCFSKLFDNPLMWSHYADKHKGVCIGFNIDPVMNMAAAQFRVMEVQYLAKVETVNFFRAQEAAFYYWGNTKSIHWQYEQEVRAIINDNSGFDLFPFDKRCVESIYFGCRQPSEQSRELVDVLITQQFNVKEIKKMVIDNSTFSIQATEFTS